MTNKPEYLGDLRKKTKPQLVEILERQQKLLEKKKFIDSLPDKGAKIKSFCEKIRAQIRQREEIDATSSLFAKLQISQERPPINSIADLDSDDEDFPDENGNDELDSSAVILQGAQAFNEDQPKVPLYADKMAEAFDKKCDEWDDLKATPKGKLLKGGNNSPRHDSNSEESISRLHKWGESAVTPPLFSNKPAKLLTIQESMELIQKQTKSLNVLENLAQRVKFADGDSAHNPMVMLHSGESDETEEDGQEEDLGTGFEDGIN